MYSSDSNRVNKKRERPDCGHTTLISEGGRDWCSACGYTGTCG